MKLEKLIQIGIKSVLDDMGLSILKETYSDDTVHIMYENILTEEYVIIDIRNMKECTISTFTKERSLPLDYCWNITFVPVSNDSWEKLGIMLGMRIKEIVKLRGY